VRAELIAARDAPNRDAVPYSPTAAGLDILRLDPDSGDPPTTHPVVHAIALLDGQATPGVLLAGRMFVSWRSEPKPVPPGRRPRRFSVPLDIGARIDGTVTSVTANGPAATLRSAVAPGAGRWPCR